MTALEAQDLAYLLPKLKAGRPYVLNLAESHQQRWARRGLTLANRTPENAPQTYTAFNAAVKASTVKLKSAKAPNALMATDPQPLNSSTSGDTQDIAFVTYPVDVGSANYAAAGLSSVYNGTTQTTIVTELIDTQSNVVYATATNTQYGQGTGFYVPVKGSVSDASHLAAMATITTVTTAADGSTTTNTVVVSTSSSTGASTATMTAPNYCVRTVPNDPSSNCVVVNGQTQYQTTSTTLATETSPIKICFARGSQASCDYYNSSTRPLDTIFFPEAGTAGFGTNTIDASTYATNGYYTAAIYDPVMGGGCVFSSGDVLNPSAGWSLTNNNTTVQWNLPQLSTNNYTGCLSRSGGRTMNFVFDVTVPLTNGSSGHVTFNSDYQPPAPAGTFGIPQLFLEDSCVAAGTMVRLADGNEVAIEGLSADQTPWVKTATGDKLQVLGTTKGVEMHPMVRLKTSLGQDLLITRTHPVLTVSGLVMARDVKKGERVNTEKGVATITSVSTENYTGQVHSLRLGWFNQPKSAYRTHTANGIYIGDSISQQQLEQEEVARLQSDRMHVAHRLPNNKWRAEYHQYLLSKK